MKNHRAYEMTTVKFLQSRRKSSVSSDVVVIPIIISLVMNTAMINTVARKLKKVVPCNIFKFLLASHLLNNFEVLLMKYLESEIIERNFRMVQHI